MPAVKTMSEEKVVKLYRDLRTTEVVTLSSRDATVKTPEGESAVTVSCVVFKDGRVRDLEAGEEKFYEEIVAEVPPTPAEPPVAEEPPVEQ